MDNDLIEIAPLAYMRGRTLNDAVVILDEGQNATVPQMKMFLTRMGQNARIVVTGDITQVDLPVGTPERAGRRGGAARPHPRRVGRCCSTAPTSSAIRWCRRSSTPTRRARPAPVARPARRTTSRLIEPVPPCPRRGLSILPGRSVGRDPERVQPPRSEAARWSFGFPRSEVIVDHEIITNGPQHRQAGAASPRHTPAWNGDRPRPRRSETTAMSIGKRRPKLSRAHLRPSAATVSLKQDRQARQRTRAALLALVAASLVATAAIVHGSGPPFTYRIGERPDRELRVNVKEFRIRNQTKTSNERQAAADQVAPVMVNDPAPILELADRLDDLTVTIAKAARFEDVPETVRAAWKLRPEVFVEIKSATDTPERRDTLHAQIAAAFQPLIRDGILGTGTLPPNEECEPDPVDPPAEGEPRVARPAGPARAGRPRADDQARWAGLPGILRGLHLAADRPDPLRPDRRSRSTARRRSPSRPRPPPRSARRRGRRVADHYDTFTPRRGARRAGPDHRRGAADPAPAGARRRRREPRVRRPRATSAWASSPWSRRSSS